MHFEALDDILATGVWQTMSELQETEGALGTAATDLLIRTKFFLPPIRADLVSRRRLLDKLGVGLSGPLTLVSAPAGFGKTTLLSQWISARDEHRSEDQREAGRVKPSRVAWLSLDRDDDDPVRLLQYIVAALNEVEPGMAAEAAMLLRASPPPPAKTVLRALLNHLAVCPGPFLLVLDDYHLLQNSAVHEAVTFLVDHLPPQVHLVLLTRSDPPLPLGRLRARGQLTEVRAADLRFTPEETTLFLNQAMQLGLSEEALAALEARTEGWIAGLRLAALSLSGRTDKESFIRSFTGSHRYLVEYLVQEVVERQPEELQNFLLATCILERMCGPLCDAVMATEEGQRKEGSGAILEQLEQTNLFVVPLDEQGYWYRYHHLFRDFLRARLNKIRPQRVAALHRAASLWHESQDLLNESVRHAVQTGDWNLTADLVERNGETLIGRGQMATLYEWCTAFPEPVLRARPALYILYAWSQTTAFRSDYRDLVEERIQRAERALTEIDGDPQARLVPHAPPVSLRNWIEGNAALIRSMLLLSPSDRFDSQGLLRLSRRALELLPASDRHSRSGSALNLAFAHMAVNDLPAAEQALEEGLRLTLEGHNYYGAAVMAFCQARLAFWQGHLQRSAEISRQRRQTLASFFEHPEQDLPAIRGLDVPLAVVQLEQNDLEGAERTLAQALDSIGWGTWMELIGYTALVRLHDIRRNHAGVLDTLARMEKLGPDFTGYAQAIRMLHAIRMDEPGAWEETGKWAEAHRTDWDERNSVPGIGPGRCDINYMQYLAWAQLQVAVGHPEDGLKFVEPVLEDALAQGLTHRIIELSLVEAQARHAQGEIKRAWQALERALTAAEPEGYLRIFDQGPALTQLLGEAAQRGIARDYIGRILSIQSITAPTSTEQVCEATRTESAAVAAELSVERVESLTERELEILKLIAEGLSNPEIAARLYIEVATVKRHINHLFGKLDVTTRTQAVARGRGLGILT